MSSSHLFLGLPTALLALHPMLRPGFHFAAFLTILSLGVKRTSLPITISYFYVSQSSKGYWLSSSFLRQVSCFFSQSVFELLPSSVSPPEFWRQSYFSSAFSSFVGSSSFLVIFLAFLHFFLVFSLCLNDEAKHLAWCRSDPFFRVHSRGSM